MEPVTFFTGLALTALGYSWWIWSNRLGIESNFHALLQLRRAQR
jgi:hypothetical protein